MKDMAGSNVVVRVSKASLFLKVRTSQEEYNDSKKAIQYLGKKREKTKDSKGPALEPLKGAYKRLTMFDPRCK